MAYEVVVETSPKRNRQVESVAAFVRMANQGGDGEGAVATLHTAPIRKLENKCDWQFDFNTMNDLTEKTLHTERKYTGKIISVDLLDIELPDG